MCGRDANRSNGRQTAGYGIGEMKVNNRIHSLSVRYAAIENREIEVTYKRRIDERTWALQLLAFEKQNESAEWRVSRTCVYC